MPGALKFSTSATVSYLQHFFSFLLLLIARLPLPSPLFHIPRSSIHLHTSLMSTPTNPSIPPPTLTPHALDLWRSGALIVRHRTHVSSGPSAFRLRIPRTVVDISLRSLRATDTRSQSSVVFTIPSASGTHPPMTAHTLLARAVSHPVTIDHHHGHLLGIQPTRNTNLTTFLQSTTHVHARDLPDNAVVSVSLDPDVHVLPLATSFWVVVHVDGLGSGELEIAFDTVSQHKPAYEIVHRVRAAAAVMTGDSDLHAGLETIVFIPNPLPFAIHDVTLCLRAGHHRNIVPPMLRYAPTSPKSARTMPTPPVRVVASDGGVLDDGESDSDVLIDPCPYEEVNAWKYMRSFEYVIPSPVSIGSRSVHSVSLGQMECEASIVHFVDDEDHSCEPYILLRNLSDDPVESGEVHVIIGDRQEIFNTDSALFKAHDAFCCQLSASATVSLRFSATRRRGRQTVVRAVGDGLVVRTEVFKTLTHALYNRQPHAQNVLVAVASSHVEAEASCTALVHDGMKALSDEGIPVEAMQPVNLGFYHYAVRLAGGQQRALVVRQRLFREDVVHVVDRVSARLVRGLRRSGGDERVSEMLEDLMRARRRWNILTERKELYERKVKQVKKGARQRADRGPPSDAEWEANGNAVQTLGITDGLEVCWRMEGGTVMLRREVEKVRAKIAEVGREMRMLKDELFAVVAASTRTATATGKNEDDGEQSRGVV